MERIKKFEDLIAWQEARKLSNMVFKICRNPNISREFDISSQIKRSSISVMENLAEGFGRYGLKEAKQFYLMARGSLAETQSHLYVLQDLEYLPLSEFKNIYVQTEHVNKLVNGLISSILKNL